MDKIVNTSRALMLEPESLNMGMKTCRIKAYLTDVLEYEPMPNNYTLNEMGNVIITPHIGSRTYESGVQQGSMALNNFFKYFVEEF